MEEGKNKEFYKKNWSITVKLLKVDKTHCIHHGYYEKGIRTHIQAVRNMNKFIEKLLSINAKDKNILDAGCGIGGTLVYLAKKYPKTNFTGITVVKDHIEMAKKYAKEKQVESTTDFILKDFTNTGLKSSHFDAIFLIESSCYAPNKKKLISELYRILKPNGKLIIVDVFLTKTKFNSFFNNFYIWFCKGWGLPNLARLEDFKNSLKKEGFQKINNKDLTKNVIKTIVRGNILSLPYIFPIIIKKIIFGKNYDISKDPRLIATSSIPCTFLGIKKEISYNVITAIK